MPGKNINRKVTGNKNGRPPKQPKDFKKAAAEQWWQYAWRGITGQSVAMGGPTGKSINRPLSEQSQLKLWETIGRKLQPDLSAQAVKAEVEHVEREPVHPRDLARSVLNILQRAKVDGPEPQSPPVPPAPLLLTRDVVIETVSAGQPEAAPSTPVGLHGDERKDNRAVMPSSGPKVVRRMPRRIR